VANETNPADRPRSRHDRGGARRIDRGGAPRLQVLWPPDVERNRNGPPARQHRDGGRSLRIGPARPKRRLPPEVLSDAEVCALMDACGRYRPLALRDRALIALLYRAGLRINEALSLYPKDLDLEGGSVRVLYGKGGKSRTVGLDPGAAAVIDRWLDARSQCLPMARASGPGATQGEMPPRYDARRGPPLAPDAFGRHPVFCSLRGRPMAAAYVRVVLKRLARRAGIDKRVHAHGLRHTHAAQLRAEGVDIAIISKQLGHASITTTARYLDHLAPTAVIEAMRHRTWTGA